MCTFGIAPSALIVEPKGVFANGLPVATVTDMLPLVNVAPFGLCISPTNPEVDAAFGVPMPCVPVVVAPWEPPGNVLVDGIPVATEGCATMCAWEGVVTILGPSPATNVEAV